MIEKLVEKVLLAAIGYLEAHPAVLLRGIDLVLTALEHRLAPVPPPGQAS